MPKHSDCIEGCFYRFCRGELGREIGAMIPRDQARLRLLRKEDIYTPLSSDAKAIAKDVQKGKADWDGAHDSGYYPHYHPAGDHDDYGHVFYGGPGYRVGEKRD